TNSIKALWARTQSIVYRRLHKNPESSTAKYRILLSLNRSGTPLARLLIAMQNCTAVLDALPPHAVPRQAESLSFQDSFNPSPKYWFCHAQQFTAVAGNRAHVSIVSVSFIERDRHRARDATPVKTGSAAN